LVQIVLCPQVRSFLLSNYQAFSQCVNRILELIETRRRNTKAKKA
jgi:hypothetical protein